VIAFEPVTPVFEIAMKNINLNPELAKKITLVNKGVSDKKETIKIKYDWLGDGGASNFIEDGLYQAEAETLTIEDIISEFNIYNPYLLKMDCEGCEDSIIFNSDLSMFEKIIFEYHTCFTGTQSNKLISKLENDGFKVTNIEGNDNIGVVHLEKNMINY
jgi:FkbM family methyltransferase